MHVLLMIYSVPTYPNLCALYLTCEPPLQACLASRVPGDVSWLRELDMIRKTGDPHLWTLHVHLRIRIDCTGSPPPQIQTPPKLCLVFFTTNVLCRLQSFLQQPTPIHRTLSLEPLQLLSGLTSRPRCVPSTACTLAYQGHHKRPSPEYVANPLLA